MYPNGQHWVPHLLSVPVRTVDFTAFSGNRAASCNDRSHGIGCIVKQAVPFGQHRTVVFPASSKQDVSAPQQKLPGRPA